jgi:hypothetical protein
MKENRRESYKVRKNKKERVAEDEEGERVQHSTQYSTYLLHHEYGTGNRSRRSPEMFTTCLLRADILTCTSM